MKLLRVADLGPDRVRRVLRRAADLEAGAAPRRLGGAVLLALFEASTRTRLGFARAAIDVGATPVVLDAFRHGPGMSAAESLSDSLAVAVAYYELIVLRHPEFPTRLPDGPATIISGGLGTEEHPTQALIDLYATLVELGRLEGLRWGLVGDLRGSRAARSLLRALAWFKPKEVRLMFPPGRGASPDVLGDLPVRPADPGDTGHLDVLYVAGLPPGTGELHLDEEGRRPWRVDARALGRLPDHARVLCPMPRIDEIAAEVDDDPRAAWLRQSARGRFVRTAVVEEVWPEALARGRVGG